MQPVHRSQGQHEVGHQQPKQSFNRTRAWEITKLVLSIVAFAAGVLLVTASIASGFGAAWGVALAFTGLPLLASAIGIQAVASSIYLLVGATLVALGIWGVWPKNPAPKPPDHAVPQGRPITRSNPFRTPLNPSRTPRQHTPRTPIKPLSPVPLSPAPSFPPPTPYVAGRYPTPQKIFIA